MKRHTTIIDIAKALGISKSTVSRALSNNSNINPDTKNRVIAMAKKMQYKPNPYAINLTRRRTKIIGVVVPEFINSFFPRIIIQIQNYFAQHDYNVLITQSNECAETERKNLQLLEDSMVEGLIISISEKEINREYYKQIIDKGIPIVFFNRVPTGMNVNSIVIDDYCMAVFAMEKLIFNGDNRRTRIMHLRGPKNINVSNLRYDGYIKALNKYKIEIDKNMIVECAHIDKNTGYEQMLRALKDGIVPEAIFAFNDQLAIGAIKAIKEFGLRVPYDIAVMGFSESQSALSTDPPLSSVAQPLEEMGHTAAKMLLDRIEDPSLPNATIVLNAKINVRESSDVALASKLK